MLLSIIIPVYKVEKYIGKCLASLYDCNASTADYEIIVVNDGTPDRSMDVVYEYAKSRSNITIINQENAGLSMARNAGLKIAQGEYIWFVDSDDWLCHNAIDNVLAAIQSTRFEIYVIPFINWLESKGDSIIEESQLGKYFVIKGSKYLFEGYYNSPAQRFIISHELIKRHNLCFYPDILHEDLEFCPRALYLAERVGFIDEPAYVYRLRAEGSITSNFNRRNFDSLKIAYDQLGKFGETHIKHNDRNYWTAYRSKHLFYFYYKLITSIRQNPDSAELMESYFEYLPLIRRNIRGMLKSKHLKKSQIKDAFLISLFPNKAFSYYLKHWQ